MRVCTARGKPVIPVLALLIGFVVDQVLATDQPVLFTTSAPRKVVDLDGQLQRLQPNSETLGYVLVFLGPECPIACKYIPELKALAADCRSKRCQFFGVLADPTLSRAQGVRFQKDFQIDFPLIFDASLSLARDLAPTHTPEAFVFSAAGELRYRGRIDDRFAAVGKERPQPTRRDLSDAVAALALGAPIDPPYAAPVGCRYEALRTAGTASPTYCRDVAPIVWNNCTGCHREGEVAPFKLLTCEDARKRAEQIAEVVTSRSMPPWKAEPGFGHFQDDRRLSAGEIDILVQWARQGAPEGNAHDLPPTPRFHSEWQLGEPDLVVTFPHAFPIPADGPDIIRYFALPIPAEATGRDVVAFEFRPGNRRVVHHAIAFLDMTGIGKRKDDADPRPGYDGFGGPGFPPIGYLGAWVPGAVVRRLPEGLGMPLPKRSMIVVMMHYYPSGKPETDQSSLGLYFARSPITRPVTSVPVTKTELTIPAGAARHRLTHSFKLPMDVTALGVTPHMHYLGREMKVTARLPGDDAPVPLIWVKDWDFNWQGQYDFQEPLRLPKDTVIEVEAFYDNSSANPRNPHAVPQVVTYGQGTTDEMCLCGVQVALDDVHDFVPYAARLMREFIKVKNGRLVIAPLE